MVCCPSACRPGFKSQGFKDFMCSGGAPPRPPRAPHLCGGAAPPTAPSIISCRPLAPLFIACFKRIIIIIIIQKPIIGEAGGLWCCSQNHFLSLRAHWERCGPSSDAKELVGPSKLPHEKPPRNQFTLRNRSVICCLQVFFGTCYQTFFWLSFGI